MGKTRHAAMRPRHKAEHMAAHDQIVKAPKTPCRAGAVHTGLSEIETWACRSVFVVPRGPQAD